MKRFLFRGAFFTLPLALLLGFPLFVLWGFGELTPPSKVVEMQQEGRPVLYNPAYTNPAKHLQLTATLERTPEILVLGNSRVSQFRGAFFRDSVSFYNATLSMTRLSDMRYVLSQIPEGKEPELIIIGPDHWFFNENFRDYDLRNAPERFSPPDPTDVYSRNWKTVYADYLGGKFDLSTIWKKDRAIGINAKVRDLGHRNDGSLHYGNIVNNPNNPALEDYNFKATFRQMDAGADSWAYGQEVSQEALEELNRFLEACAARDIEVIGFLPIYAHAVYEEIQDRPKEYGYMIGLRGVLAPLFEAHGYEFYDFSDIRSVGSSDEEALDGRHGSEKSHLRLVLKLAQEGSVLRQYVDVEELRSLLQACEGHLECVEPAHS